MAGTSIVTCGWINARISRNCCYNCFVWYREFYVLSKQWERNPKLLHVSLFLYFRIFRLSYTFFRSELWRKSGTASILSLNELGCFALQSGRHLQAAGNLIPSVSTSLHGRRLFQTVGKFLPDYTASHNTQNASYWTPEEPQIPIIQYGLSKDIIITSEQLTNEIASQLFTTSALK
jgi:hypothetical protein